MVMDWGKITKILEFLELAKDLKQKELITEANFDILKTRLNDEAHAALGL